VKLNTVLRCSYDKNTELFNYVGANSICWTITKPQREGGGKKESKYDITVIIARHLARYGLTDLEQTVLLDDGHTERRKF
jgi:hypothetical protein